MGEYVMTQLQFICIYAIVGLGLMLLVGFTGQISLGHAAFLAIGAYTEALLQAKGVPFFISLPCAALFSAATGWVLGLPALRLKGIYLAIATIAFNVIIEEVITRWEGLTGGNAGLHLKPIELFGMKFDGDQSFYYLCLGLTILSILALMNLLRSPTGRAFVAIRDSEISASCMGVNLATYKTMSFALSAALTGIAGALYAHKVTFISPEQFTLIASIELVTIVILGGVGFIHGAVLGAGFLIVLPQLISLAKDYPLVKETLPASVLGSGLQAVVFGLVLIFFIIFEPLGLYGRWLKVRTWFELFPFYRRGMFRRQKSYMKSERLR
jgi:branched-chain amino acid transport system permease protein